MRIIKVHFARNYHIKTRIESLLKKVAQKNNFELQILDKDYDYFFCNENIYHDKKIYQESINQAPNTIRIFTCDEAIYPDLNLFDYAVCFDDFDKDRIIKYPLKMFLNDQFNESQLILEYSKQNINGKDILREKTKFCNFIYSNPHAHPMRDNLFYTLSKYKKVDSLGKHLNNSTIPHTRQETKWRTISIELKKPYKFSIAAENAYFKGYISEKIITSMMANTIPVYFGTSEVIKYFNPKSFINVNDFSSLEDVVKKVKEIDENDDLYLEMISQPWRTKEQIDLFDKEYEEYLKRFYHIFEQDFDKAHRRPQGCWPDFLYPSSLTLFQETTKDKFIKKLKNSINKRLRYFTRSK